jgi:hypothetical protein
VKILAIAVALFCALAVASHRGSKFESKFDLIAPALAFQNGAAAYVSDMTFCYSQNGWGPVEKDGSNGENLAKDGNIITLNGVTYAKGLGVHANSDVRFRLAGEYTSFVSSIGVDDEVGINGSVIFQVYADGTLLYDSGVMYGYSATRTVNVSVAGRNELQLVVNYAGDNIDNDHADWAGAYLVRAAQQQIKYFGYAGPGNASELSRVSSYSNFSYIGGSYTLNSYDTSITTQLNDLHNNGMKAVIDLGRVLWQDLGSDKWSLYPDYQTRWTQWTWANPKVLDPAYVVAYSVMTEPTRRAPNNDTATMFSWIDEAAAYLKTTAPIPTMMIDDTEDVVPVGDSYVVPQHLDWVGMSKYYTHPDSDTEFQASVSILKNKKQCGQKTVYVLDGFYKEGYHPHAPTSADMDLIAQQWYNVASQDPEAILLGVFLWDDLTGECGRGSRSFPQNVLNTHAAIGQAILTGGVPAFGTRSSNATIFTTQQPASELDAGGVTWEEATQFSSSVNGRITAIRFYRDSLESGVHYGRIWSDTGTLLAQVTFNELPSFCPGWQEQVLSTPLPITAGVRYRVSYNLNSNLAKTFGGLNTPVTNGPLTAYAGFYSTPAGTFPNTGSGSNFFADVLFSTP